MYRSKEKECTMNYGVVVLQVKHHKYQLVGRNNYLARNKKYLSSQVNDVPF